MTQKAILEAAEEYAYANWAGGGFECASNDSFEAGAKYVINSAWHLEVDDNKVNDEEVLAETKFGWKVGKFTGIGTFHEYVGLTTLYGEEYAIHDIIRYAYIKDLILTDE